MIDTPQIRHWFMHLAHGGVGIVAADKLRPVQPPTPFVPQTETRTLRIGLIAGAEATWDAAAARLIEHLRKDDRLEVCHAWDCVDLGIEDQTDYDCLVLLGWPAATSRERIKRIELHCRGGGSLVVLRAMQANVPSWSNFAEEVLGGRQPVGQRCRLIEIERSETAWHHPVLKGVGSMIAEGEVYEGPRLSPDTIVLLTAEGAARRQPVAWVYRHRGGRVFCSTLGHDDDFREPGFLRLVANAVNWTGVLRG